jgi:hypothetical protein
MDTVMIFYIVAICVALCIAIYVISLWMCKKKRVRFDNENLEVVFLVPKYDHNLTIEDGENVIDDQLSPPLIENLTPLL